MTRGCPSLLLLALPGASVLGLACSDQSLGRFNTAPEASITSHSDGDEVLEAYEITVRGSASDPNHDTSQLEATWYLADQVACEASTPDEDGVTTCVVAPVPGREKLSLEVRDPDNAATSTSITLAVVPTLAPTATITSPTEDGRYYVDEKLTFEALVDDAEDDPADLAVVWESDLDGVLDLPGAPDSGGQVTTSGYLSVGQHALSLRVTDLSGKTGTDQVIVTVGQENSPPSCGITQPTDGLRVEAGTELVLSGWADDADQPLDSLSFDWDSSLDGSVASGAPSSSGAIDTTWFSASSGVHVLTLRVSDELDAVCTDTVSLTVGDPPAVSITSPADGSTVQLGATVVFQGQVADDSDAPEDLLLSWSSDLDGEWSTAAADSSGTATATTGSLSAGLHTITLAATDSDGAVASDTITLTVNQAPTAPVVHIEPASPLTDDDLGVVIDVAASDPEGDSLSYRTTWYRDSVEVTDYTGTTVPSSATARDQVWRVEVVASDGTAEGEVGSASVTVGNTPPELASASLSPGTVYTDDTITLSTSTADADGDEVDLDVQWYVGGSLVGASGSSLSGATWFDKGDSVYAVVTPADDGASGDSLTTDPVTVLNTPPVIDSLSVGPSSVGTDDTLSATVSTSDADGDAVSLSYQWTVDGAVVAESSSSLDGSTWFDSGDEIVLTVTPSDGEDDGDPVSSATIVVGNSAPRVDSISLAPDPLYTDDTLVATVATSDADGDTVSLAYSWVVDGSTVGASGSSLSGSTWFDKGQDIYVVVTPSDASGSGSAVTSDTVTVANTRPQVDSISLSPGSVYTDTTLTASVSGSDADGDGLSYSYAWTVSGSSTGETGSSLAGSAWFDKGDTVQVRITPDDGEEDGEPVDSATITVLNSPPSAPVVAIDPSDPVEGLDELWCELVTAATDADGDPVDHSFSWTVDGDDFTSASTTVHDDDTVPADETVADEDWTCTVATSDGEEAGGSDADTVTILSGDLDYSGLWELDSAVYYRCAYGLVLIDFESWYIEDDYPSISVTSTSSSQPGTMTGSFPTSSTFIGLRSIAGTCTETYQVSGTFVDEDTIEGDFSVSFSGGAWCFDCVDQSWEFTATR